VYQISCNNFKMLIRLIKQYLLCVGIVHSRTQTMELLLLRLDTDRETCMLSNQRIRCSRNIYFYTEIPLINTSFTELQIPSSLFRHFTWYAHLLSAWNVLRSSRRSIHTPFRPPLRPPGPPRPSPFPPTSKTSNS
jgi:hypothetical protein